MCSWWELFCNPPPPPGQCEAAPSCLCLPQPPRSPSRRGGDEPVDERHERARVGHAQRRGEEKALLVGLKNSGPGVAAATYVFLGLAVVANVDPAPLIWHAQWVTFGPWLEGYAGNTSIIWSSTTPPTGTNPDGVEFVYERWTSSFWPLALNFSWTESFGLVESLAADFSSCSVKDYSFNVSVASASNASNTTSGGGGRRLNVPLVESCSFKDRVSD